MTEYEKVVLELLLHQNSFIHPVDFIDQCRYCGAFINDLRIIMPENQKITENHAPNCPWTRGMKLLEEENK